MSGDAETTHRLPALRHEKTGLPDTLNKHFRENELSSTTKHTIYSLRHAFEYRVKNAGIDHEVRRILWTETALDYGQGGSMERR